MYNKKEMKNLLSVYDKTLNRYICSPTNVLDETTTDAGYTYEGRTKNLRQIEALFGEIMYDLSDMDQSILDTYNVSKMKMKILNDIRKSDQLKKICKLFEDEFGFRQVRIFIEPVFALNPISAISGYTIPQSYFVRDLTTGMPSLLKFKGKYYDEKHQYYLGITMISEFLDRSVFTPAEVVAMLLHEIGHNFEVSITSYIAEVWSYCLFTTAVFSNQTSTTAKKIFKMLQDSFGRLFPDVILGGIDKWTYLFINNFPMFANIIKSILDTADKALKYVLPVGGLSAASDLIEKLSTSADNFNINGTKIARNFLGFGSERAADSFATIYGYGDAFVSFIHKVDERYTIRDKGIILDAIGYIGGTFQTIINMTTGSHPENQTRMQMIIDDLKELKDHKGFPPHVRDMIKKDYDLSVHAYNRYLEVSKDPNLVGYIERYGRLVKDVIKADSRAYLLNTSMIRATLLQRVANKIRGIEMGG